MKIFTCLLYFIFLVFISLLYPFTSNANFTQFTKYHLNPVISLGSSGSWDQSNIWGPSVIWTDNIGEIWFSGDNGLNKKQIGYATIELNQTDDIIINKNVSPVIKYDFINSSNLGVEQPFVSKENNNNAPIYKLWFNNIYGGGNYYFKLHYSTSSDGKNWTSYDNIIIPFNNYANSISNPSLIYQSDTNKYQLWFSARYPQIDWIIGYAESINGIDNWSNVIFPVIMGENDWEGSEGLGSPNVIYDSGIYYLFYDAWDTIYYATSFDGINWNKNKNIKILEIDRTPGSTSFDNYRISFPHIVKHNGKYYLFYSGQSISNHLQIGVAVSDELPPVIYPSGYQSPTPTPTSFSIPTTTPTPTPTPTPSSTPTPTYTPSPTNTPSFTPTPSNTPPPSYTPSPTIVQTTPIPIPKPIIVILPGLGASWSPEDIFSCDLNKSGNWKLAPYASVYNRLIKTFTNKVGLKMNDDVYLYTYDWRQPLGKQGTNFKSYLDKILSNKPNGTKAYLVGHSLGGLVIRSYLTQYPNDDKVRKAITAGSPHQGTILAYPTWENGEFWTSDRVEKIALDQVINNCRIKLVMKPKFFNLTGFNLITRKEALQKASPIIRDILPTFDYIVRNNILIHSNTLIHQNLWLKNNPTLPSLPQTDFYSLSGTNSDTLKSLTVINPSGKDQNAGNWQDGLPTNKTYTKEGDGTVLNMSSQLPNISNILITGNHSDIISSTGAIQEILDIFGYSSFSPALFEPVLEKESNSALTVSTDSPAKMSLIDPKGKITEYKDDKILVNYNPLIGIYRLKIKPNQSGKGYLYINRYEAGKEDKILTQEISFTKNKEASYLIINTPLQPPKIINFF